VIKGGEIGVDRHLLSRHRIQGEAGRHFGDASRALGDDDEIDDHQDREDDDADDEIAAHHEAAERFDDVAGGARPLVPVRQDEPGRGQIERQTNHRRQQQDGRKGGEVEGLGERERRLQNTLDAVAERFAELLAKSTQGG
jgi:hypothetical protein